MSIIGIVGEYNPFHSGHEYHIRQSRLNLGGLPGGVRHVRGLCTAGRACHLFQIRSG